MRILIADDTIENLEAAKKAAINFPEQEFYFTNSAKEAMTQLAKVDAVITDLFFPDEGHEDGEALDVSYSGYRSKMIESPALDEVVRNYYHGEKEKAEEKLENVLMFLEDGTIRSVIEGLILLFEERGGLFDERSANRFREVLRNLPAPKFPYGAALMLHAKNLERRCCLVSDIHCHAGECKNAPSAFDAMILLLPLIEEDIITVKQAMDDGRGSLTYLGESEVHALGKGRRGKNDSAVWVEAITRILQQ